MRPAGAIAPFDVEGGSLTLSWEAGAEAYFYRALAAAYKAAGLSSSSRPERFDWPRFRLLMASAAVPKELREDPWLTDWKAAAEQTARSGFDRRRIRARSSKMLTVKIPWPGPWTGSSPFTKARLLEAGGAAELEAGAETDIMVSKDGILKYSVDGVIAVSW
jgi:hypothetical protein